MKNCIAVQQSDEMFCAKCNLRWDVNDPAPPACRKPFLGSDREKLEKVAQGYNDLMALQATQRSTMALLVRACVRQLKNPSPAERQKAIVALTKFAWQLEAPR